MLAFILGIWLWDHYFGKAEGYAPGTEEIALVKIDRDLRLADAMEEDPEWLKWLAGVDEPATTRAEALEVFRKLAAEKSISPQGLEAFAIVKAVQEGLPMQVTLGEVAAGRNDFRVRGNLGKSRQSPRHLVACEIDRILGADRSARRTLAAELTVRITSSSGPAPWR